MGAGDVNKGAQNPAEQQGAANKPKTAEELKAEKEAKAGETAAATADKVTTDVAVDVEAGLNQPVKAPEPEIALSSVQSMMQKKASELNDEEAKLLANYYTQEAKKADQAGESFKAIMMHVRAFLTSLKLDFLSAPADLVAKKEGDAGKPGSPETTLPAPKADEKPSPIETIGLEVEQAKGVPSILLLAMAKGDNREITKENLTLIADDVIAKLGKDKPDKNDPVKYLTAYMEKKMGIKKDDPASQKKLAEAIAEAHLVINKMYGNKEISYTGYYKWASKMQTPGGRQAGGVSNGPKTIDRNISPELAKEGAPNFKDRRINYTGQISERVKGKLNNDPQLISWMMKCCQMFNVSPNLVAAILAVECGREGKDLSPKHSGKFHFNAVNKRTHAQGAAQAMPAYVEGWLRRDKPIMDSMPELAHAKGKGELWVRRNHHDVTKPVAPDEYDMQDPYVGIFYGALFVKNHLATIVKNGSYKKVTPNWQDLNYEYAAGIVYANHNMGAGGAASFLKRSNGNLSQSGVVKLAMSYARAFDGDQQSSQGNLPHPCHSNYYTGSIDRHLFTINF